MKKKTRTGKLMLRAALGALILSAVPYSIRKDEEAGTVEIRSLLWGLKKKRRAEGEEKDHYAFAIPASALDRATFDEAEDLCDEEAAEETAEA